MASADQAQLVKDALATGIFVERTEPTKNRKYYVNRKTKESFWHLTKEIVAKAQAMVSGGGGGGGAGGGGVAAIAAAEEKRAVVRDERLEQTRKRAEIEAQLRASVSALERQKYELEAELAGIEGPVEGEIEELEILRRELADSRSSLVTVEKDVVQQRKKRYGDLQDILSKVAAMQSLAESEKRHREAVETRHNTLVEEGFELKADIQKERSALEGLKASLEVSEKRIIETEGKLQRQRELITYKEEEIGRAEAELKRLCQAKAKVDDDVAKQQQSIAEMTKRVETRQSFAQQSLSELNEQLTSRTGTRPNSAAVSPTMSRRGGGMMMGTPTTPLADTSSNNAAAISASSQQLLFHLVGECEGKRHLLGQLQRSSDRRDDVSRVQEENARLRHLIATFGHDRKQLEQLDRFLKHQLTQAHAWVLDAKAECLALAEEVGVMDAAAASAKAAAASASRQQQRRQY